jgi:hypothetical protein
MSAALAPAVGSSGSGGGSSGGTTMGTSNLGIIPQLLMAFGPAIVAKMFGWKTAAEKEAERLAKEKTSAMDQIRALYDPAFRARLQAQYYQQNLSSPAYAEAQGKIAQGANQSAAQIASSLGQTGLTSSGAGAIMSGMVPSMVGRSLAGLGTAAYNAGGTAADASIEGQAAAIMRALGTQGASAGPSMPAQMAGAGLTDFSKYLGDWLTKRAAAPATAPTAAVPASVPSSTYPGYWPTLAKMLNQGVLR